jgi:hypothetical protein
LQGQGREAEEEVSIEEGGTQDEERETQAGPSWLSTPETTDWGREGWR